MKKTILIILLSTLPLFSDTNKKNFICSYRQEFRINKYIDDIKTKSWESTGIIIYNIIVRGEECPEELPDAHNGFRWIKIWNRWF